MNHLRPALGMAWTAIWFTLAGVAFTLAVYALPIAVTIVRLLVEAAWRNI